MKTSDFDQMSRRLAHSRMSRRKSISLGWRAGLILGSLRAGMATRRVLGAPATPATPEQGAGPDDTYLCKQPYALCTGAPCEQPNSGSTDVACRCHVLNGYNIGYSTCEERVPSGRKLLSTFSTQNVTTSTSATICPDASPWANCLDMPCEIDADDPTAATCQCPIVDSGPWVTFDFDGGCDMSMCSSGIWSAATLTLPVASIYEDELKKLGQETHFPAACPGAMPMASPQATP
jgi:hypothetical protein